MAMRSAELPHVTAYWFTLPWIAAHAASFIGSGIGKSGNPCARFTASCWLAMRVISRMTDSVNEWVRRAASIRPCARVLTAECKLRRRPGWCQSSLPPPDPRQCRPDQLRRAHPLCAAVQCTPHRLLGVGRRIAERYQRADRVLRARRATPAHARFGARALKLVQLVGEVEH